MNKIKGTKISCVTILDTSKLSTSTSSTALVSTTHTDLVTQAIKRALQHQKLVTDKGAAKSPGGEVVTDKETAKAPGWEVVTDKATATAPGGDITDTDSVKDSGVESETPSEAGVVTDRSDDDISYSSSKLEKTKGTLDKSGTDLDQKSDVGSICR